MFGKVKHEVQVGDFYQIVNNKLKKEGFAIGDSVYVAGSSYINEDQRDPHNFRKKFIVAKLKEDHIDTSGGFVVDAKSLGILPSYEQERLKNIYEEDFGDNETPN